MKHTIKISETVINRLLNVKEPCLGNLYGVFYNKTQYVTGLYLNNEDQNLEVTQYFPTEIELCGVFEVSEDQFDLSKISNTIENVFVTDNPVYLQVKLVPSRNDIQPNFVIHNQIEITSMEILTENDLLSEFVYIRLMAQFPLVCVANEDHVKEALQELRRDFDCGRIVFRFTKENVFLMSNDVETGVSGSSGDCTVGQLFTQQCEKVKKTKTQASLDVLSVNVLKRLTQDHTSEPKSSHAPIVYFDKKKYESLTMLLNIDALSMVPRNMPIKNLYEILVASCCRNLLLIKRAILKHFQQSDGDTSKACHPEVYHFYPKACGHFFTTVYNRNENEESLVNERKHLHSDLLLPIIQPLFRRANRYQFRDDTSDNSILRNPHEDLKLSGNDGEVAIVKGVYEYYHYCQNNMDDKGWGCAYRSLQTLASWFHLQGYTAKPVPTFKDIQKCLVDIGDKPSSFIGSKQWIGSTECNFVLESLLGITCKILYCSSGKDVETKGPELVTHFNTHGSPVMIGGGVLAHTILGVDYNLQTGKTKFLILDPHYTGSENLQVIQNKGWCGWKGVDFWDKTAYYNMCLPLVPRCI